MQIRSLVALTVTISSIVHVQAAFLKAPTRTATYITGPNFGVSCDHGSYAVPYGDCSKAATSLSAKWAGRESKSDRPRGCYQTGHTQVPQDPVVSYNDHDIGQADMYSQPVCTTVKPTTNNTTTSGQAARHQDSNGFKGSCDITDLFLRGEAGFPIQVEKKGDSYEGTMCTDVPAARVSVKQNEPVFTTGITCTISGVPAGTATVEEGATKVVDITVVEKPSPKDKDGKEITTKYTLTLKRLGVTADQGACKVTRKRSAIQDCGYAPLLEKKRQEAAMIKGMKPPPTPAPSQVPVIP